MPQLVTPRGGMGGGMGAPVRAQVLDVAKQPELKAALLSGRLQGLTAPFCITTPASNCASPSSPWNWAWARWRPSA
ncbi:MAG: hypothetical protein HC853_10565 [Anaerolineae bacterium]|nr:hypothetical protein [Anaerolineae bacterium]